jgi:cell pole-organizing protein PopZ
MTATNDASYKTELNAEQKAHETSMDDILASIRRIIADDDALPLSRRARAAAALATASAPVSAPAPVSTPAPAIRATPVSDAFVSLGQRLTRRSAPVEPEVSFTPSPVAPLAPKPPLFKLRRFAPNPEPAPEANAHEVSAEEVSVAEVSADQVPPREIPARTSSASPAPLELRPSLVEAEKPVERSAEPTSASVVTLVQPSPQAVESRLKIASLAFRAPVFAPAPERTVEKPVQDEVKAIAPEPRAESVETPPAAEEKSEPALLSPANGSRIGASFEALAESLLLRDPRTIERLTREMLRPMLKEWLDDHLPDVVERLVRAEIERVARGGG